MYTLDKNFILDHEIINIISNSKNPRRQRLGVLLRVMALMNTDNIEELNRAADSLGLTITQNIVFLNLEVQGAAQYDKDMQQSIDSVISRSDLIRKNIRNNKSKEECCSG